VRVRACVDAKLDHVLYSRTYRFMCIYSMYLLDVFNVFSELSLT